MHVCCLERPGRKQACRGCAQGRQADKVLDQRCRQTNPAPTGGAGGTHCSHVVSVSASPTASGAAAAASAERRGCRVLTSSSRRGRPLPPSASASAAGASSGAACTVSGACCPRPLGLTPAAEALRGTASAASASAASASARPAGVAVSTLCGPCRASAPFEATRGNSEPLVSASCCRPLEPRREGPAAEVAPWDRRAALVPHLARPPPCRDSAAAASPDTAPLKPSESSSSLSSRRTCQPARASPLPRLIRGDASARSAAARLLVATTVLPCHSAGLQDRGAEPSAIPVAPCLRTAARRPSAGTRPAPSKPCDVIAAECAQAEACSAGPAAALALRDVGASTGATGVPADVICQAAAPPVHCTQCCVCWWRKGSGKIELLKRCGQQRDALVNALPAALRVCTAGCGKTRAARAQHTTPERYGAASTSYEHIQPAHRLETWGLPAVASCKGQQTGHLAPCCQNSANLHRQQSHVEKISSLHRIISLASCLQRCMTELELPAKAPSVEVQIRRVCLCLPLCPRT